MNIRQRRWLELINNYDLEFIYHEGKANVVVDALSRKTSHFLGALVELHRDIEKLNLEIVQRGELESRLASLSIQPIIFEEILASQSSDPLLEKMREYIKEGTREKMRVYIPIWKRDDISMDFV